MAALPTTLTPIIEGYSKTVTPRYVRNRRGDGYTQVIVDGINAQEKKVTLEFMGADSEIQEYTDFLDARTAVAADPFFTYTLPNESTSRTWTYEFYSVDELANDVLKLTITMNMEHVLA